MCNLAGYGQPDATSIDGCSPRRSATVFRLLRYKDRMSDLVVMLYFSVALNQFIHHRHHVARIFCKLDFGYQVASLLLFSSPIFFIGPMKDIRYFDLL